MTQQPPLQPPEQGDEGQHTTPFWYPQTQAQPQYPAYPPVANELGQPGEESARRARPRRFVGLVAVAALAAVLSSLGTFALTRGETASTPVAQIRTSASSSQVPVSGPVVQANPSAPDWSVTAAAVSPSVVAITVMNGQTGGQGSGVILDTAGHILTNNHVVTAGGQGGQITVTLNDKRTYDATVVGTDPSSDLAVIKLTGAPQDLKAIRLGDANILKVGEPVMAVGNPLGLAGTVTTGIVSALNRPVTTSAQSSGDFQQPTAEPVVTNAVQTSAAINPGNSGGALVNGSGQLVGINSAIAQLGNTGGGGQGGNIGIGFAIPVNESKSVADQLIRSGKATHAFLGVSSRDDIVADGSAKRPAAVVTDVASGSPADKVGLSVGDAIIAVDGETIDGSLSLVAQVREHTPGDQVTLKVLRDGKTREVGVTLAPRPATNP
jgi:putative serine protease PepD